MNISPQRPLDSFEAALLTELRETVSQRAAAPAKRRTRSVAAVAVAGIAALATGIGLTSMGGSPAFAVETAADGEIIVRIHELTDAAGLEQALADQGVTAKVQYGGEAGNTINVDQDGNVTAAEEPPGRDMPEGGKMVTRLDGDGKPSTDAQHGPPDENPCGDPAALPVAVALDGADYVITIDGDSQVAKEIIAITAFSRGEGADIVVSFAPAAGSMCTLGTSTN